MEIPLELYFYGPLTFGLLLILITSGYYGLFRRSSGTTRRANIYRCEHCRHVYVDPRVVPLSRCPRCKKLNEALIR